MKGKRYSPEEAQGRIPEVARRVALQAVDLVIALEKHRLDSQAIEQRVWALTGQTGYLMRLCHVIWRASGLKKAREQGAI